MSDIAQEFLAEVEGFLQHTGMAPSYFGVCAVKNCKLVQRLREGRSIEVKTIERTRRFMREFLVTAEPDKLQAQRERRARLALLPPRAPRRRRDQVSATP